KKSPGNIPLHPKVFAYSWYKEWGKYATACGCLSVHLDFYHPAFAVQFPLTNHVLFGELTRGIKVEDIINRLNPFGQRAKRIRESKLPFRFTQHLLHRQTVRTGFQLVGH